MSDTELETEIDIRMVTPQNDAAPYLAEAALRSQQRLNVLMLWMTAAVLVLTLVNVSVFVFDTFKTDAPDAPQPIVTMEERR